MKKSLATPSNTVLFSQPTYNDGIAGHFSVTGVVPAYNPVGAFFLHANQPNPFRKDNNYVPTPWDAGVATGLHVPHNRLNWQRGIWVPAQATGRWHTTAQVSGPAVGAYLNSADLVDGSAGDRMMISPGYRFATDVRPFAAAGAVLGIALDLQVPTATDSHMNRVSNTYAKIDLLLICKSTGGRVSVSCGLFANGGSPKSDGVGFDSLTNTSIMDALVSPAGQLVDLQPGSASYQSAPWLGWRHFSFTMSQAQFVLGLGEAAKVARENGDALSLDPTDYALSSTHLNAELHYSRQYPATLGWSMRNLTLTQIG